MTSSLVQIKQEVVNSDEEKAALMVTDLSGTSLTSSTPLTVVTGTNAQSVTPQLLFSNAELLQKNIHYLNGMVAANNLVATNGMVATSVPQPTLITTPATPTNGSVLVVPQPFQQYFTYLRQPAFTSAPVSVVQGARFTTTTSVETSTAT